MSGTETRNPDDGRPPPTAIRPSTRLARLRFRPALALTVAVSVLVGTLASPTLAAPTQPTNAKVGEHTDDPQASDKMSKESLETMLRQDKLQPALRLLYAAQRGDEQSGFAGVAVDGTGLTLYYKGELTAAMRAAVGSARRYGEVKVKPAAHSMAELQDAGRRIRDAEKSLGDSDIQEIGYLPDGSGLKIEKMPPGAAVGALRRLEAKGQKFVTAEGVLAAAQLSVPVKVSTATEVIRRRVDGCEAGAIACRNNDYPDWNGGGAFETWRGNDGRGRCTTGFGVLANGYYAVLTAAHCGTPPDIAWQGRSDISPWTLQEMGPVSNDAWSYDVMLINAPGSVYIFDGGTNTSNVKTVTDYGYWAAGVEVCQSGISSGVVCDLEQQYSADVTVACEDENGQPTGDSDGDCGYDVYGLIRTNQQYGQTASRSGDSGGPVFTIMGGTSNVRAMGILSMGSGSTMWFQDWYTIESLFNAYPNYCVNHAC